MLGGQRQTRRDAQKRLHGTGRASALSSLLLRWEDTSDARIERGEQRILARPHACLALITQASLKAGENEAAGVIGGHAARIAALQVQ